MEPSQHLSPSRLVAAREYRGLTQKELAEKIGVTSMAVSAYEKGAYQPTKDKGVVQQISFALRFPIGWFYDSDIHLLHSTTPTFRSRRHMTAALRGQATRSCDIAVSVIAPALRRRFRTPTVALPNLSRETPEVAATYIRDEWKLGQGPINNVVHSLEAKGAMVFWTNIEDDSLDACSFWLNEQPVILLNSHKRAGDRSLLSAATKSMAFEVTPSVYSDRFFPLKRRWKVSVAALVRRSRDVGILSQDQYERAIKEIGFRGWRVQEPDEIAMDPETSLLHEKIFEAMKAKGNSPSDLAYSLNLSFDIFRSLMPLAADITERITPTVDNVLKFEAHTKNKRDQLKSG